MNEDSTPPEIMTRRMIRNASRKVGGQAALVAILRQWSHAGDGEAYLDLREQLLQNTALTEIFAQVPDGGPYVEISRTAGGPLPGIEVTYGHCYGGTCGSATTHFFQKVESNWNLLPGPGAFRIH